MRKVLLCTSAAIMSLLFMHGNANSQSVHSSEEDVAAHTELVQQYCVVCHNDTIRTANLSLQNLDLTEVSQDAEIWEKVIRKLRAGMMPPPGMPRPSLAEYNGIRDWLENKIDGQAERIPGTKVLHRLKRTEYALSLIHI